jgi:hypothetical protein
MTDRNFGRADSRRTPARTRYVYKRSKPLSIDEAIEELRRIIEQPADRVPSKSFHPSAYRGGGSRLPMYLMAFAILFGLVSIALFFTMRASHYLP